LVLLSQGLGLGFAGRASPHDTPRGTRTFAPRGFLDDADFVVGQTVQLESGRPIWP